MRDTWDTVTWSYVFLIGVPGGQLQECMYVNVEWMYVTKWEDTDYWKQTGFQCFMGFIIHEGIKYMEKLNKDEHDRSNWALPRDITRWSILKSDWLYYLQPKMKTLFTVSKTRPGADCGSDHELLIAKFRLKLKKVGKTTRPLRYNLNKSLTIIEWKWEKDLRE